MTPPFLTRVKIHNYKSIASCDVELSPLQFIVGPNGSGKSNFVDAVRFVAEALDSTVEHALHGRGGINEVRRKSRGHPTHFAIQLSFSNQKGISGNYAFKIGSKKGGGFEIQDEKLAFTTKQNRKYGFHVKGGEVIQSSIDLRPQYSKDRLYLFVASSFEEFRPVYDSLVRMNFFNLNPSLIRELQPADASDRLHSDGKNLASIFGRLDMKCQKRVVEYLAALVPGIRNVKHIQIAGNETLEFRQAVKGDSHAWKFYARSMSDGTLRALAILIAVLQSRVNETGPTLIGIEEPEIALHPAGAAILLDALKEAASRRQILVTSHSPDILDSENVNDRNLIAVESVEGITKLGKLNAVGRTALKEKLYTPGELLRMNQLAPDIPKNGSIKQLELFNF